MHHDQTRTSHFFHHNILVPENPVLSLKGERGQGTDLRALRTLTAAVLTAASAVLGTEPRASRVLDRRPKTEPHTPPSSATLNSYPKHPRSYEMPSCGVWSVIKSAPSAPSHRLSSLQAGPLPGLLLRPCQSVTSTPVGTTSSQVWAHYSLQQQLYEDSNAFEPFFIVLPHEYISTYVEECAVSYEVC